jgi:hypothetical protein
MTVAAASCWSSSQDLDDQVRDASPLRRALYWTGHSTGQGWQQMELRHRSRVLDCTRPPLPRCLGPNFLPEVRVIDEVP